MKKSDLDNVKLHSGNLPHYLETGVDLPPNTLAKKAIITLDLEQAKGIIEGMGMKLPATIYKNSDLDNFIKELGGSFTDKQIDEFFQKAINWSCAIK